MSNELFEDVQAMARMSTSLATPEQSPPRDVAALERGTREYPDGTVVSYERIEFVASS